MKILERLSWLITVRPWITLLVLLIVTVVLAAGADRRAPPTEGASLAFLPAGHPITTATNEIDEFFADTGDVRLVTILFRGEAFTPDGLAQMSALVDKIASDPGVSELLVAANPVASPASLIQSVLGVESLDSVTQAEIDAARGAPDLQGAFAALAGNDTDGTPVAIATINLIDTGDERIEDAERKISDFAAADEGPLRVSSLSPVIIEDEYKEATESGMAVLMLAALVLIAVLLLLFTRSLSDMLLTLVGLILAIIWTLGAEGWLGPEALGVIGPPSSLTALVPVIIISLTVDYAIQSVSHYREQRVTGEPVVEAVRKGLRNVHRPIDLGGGHDDCGACWWASFPPSVWSETSASSPAWAWGSA